MNNNEGRKIILDDNINNDEQDNLEYDRNLQLDDEQNYQEEDLEVEPKKSSGLFHIEKSERNSEGKKLSAPLIAAIIIFGAIIIYIIVLLLTGTLFEKKVKPSVNDNILLTTACSDLNEQGSLKEENPDVKCKNFVCEVKKSGASKDCRGK